MERLCSKEKKIKSLITKHQKFDSLIQKFSNKLSVDDLIINDLKKKKLKIRDEISRLRN
tara:strand:+ start:225 stop:401 length:177 start_codon:yes stop_codon:yes gene_type:complete